MTLKLFIVKFKNRENLYTRPPPVFTPQLEVTPSEFRESVKHRKN